MRGREEDKDKERKERKKGARDGGILMCGK